MSAEQNMALARRSIEARLKGDLDALYEMMAPITSATLNCFPTNSPAAKAQNGRLPNSPPLSLTSGY
jgi:hypothetical protein